MSRPASAFTSPSPATLRITGSARCQRNLGLIRGLVVEANGHQPVHAVEHRERVQLQRRPRVLRPHDCPCRRGHRADTYVRNTVHRHEAVCASPGTAKQSSGPMVLEAATEQPHSCRMHRGSYRVSLEGGEVTSVKSERNASIPVQRLRVVGRKSEISHARARLVRMAAWWPWSYVASWGASSGQNARTTPLVTVFLSARNQRRQPNLWYHHSRCTPAVLLL